METHHLTHRVVGPLSAPQRIDVLITEELKLFPRSQLKQRIQKLLVNGREVKPSKRVKANDLIEIEYSDPLPTEIVPQAMPLDIIYEDDDVIVINKPQGLVVHPGAGNFSHTLVNGILAHCVSLGTSFCGTPIRPGIVHRLDKDTSGVIITAKHPAALEFLSEQFRKRRVAKLYYAIVKGKLEECEGIIETAIERDRVHRKRFVAHRIVEGTLLRGRRAKTRYRVVREWEGLSLVLLKPQTGRTHQLRVHMKYSGTPIVGDAIYGREKKESSATLMLHAWKLAIILPAGRTRRVFIAPLPERFKKILPRSGNGDRPH